MYKILVVGAGKIGSLISCMFAQYNDYSVYLADLEFTGSDVKRVRNVVPQIQIATLDVTHEASVIDFLKEHQIHAVVSSLPYFLNIHVARAAQQSQVAYFDLTEDTAVTAAVKEIAQSAQSAFVPQCGLAPGFISIAANSLMQEFDRCCHAKLRVGALPQRVNNALHYSLTWSTDGVINEYGNPCYGIESGRVITLKPLEGLESIQIDGCQYEAFNTSGGLGSLSDLYDGDIQTLNYKTIRYPGHCEKMRLLLNDLKLNENRAILKGILENAIPKTNQDMVIIYVTVEGYKHGELIEKSYIKKIYPGSVNGLAWSAIQISTASGVCAVVDLVLQREQPLTGLVLQEQFPLLDLTQNRFGQCYKEI